MANSNLIPIFTGKFQHTPVQLYNARDLHTFLESKQHYSCWIKTRIISYGFVENEDFSIVVEDTNGRPRKEYHITLDMGKELAMLERNEKGRQIRRYFIECEKQIKQNQLPTLKIIEEYLAPPETVMVEVRLLEYIKKYIGDCCGIALFAEQIFDDVCDALTLELDPYIDPPSRFKHKNYKTVNKAESILSRIDLALGERANKDEKPKPVSKQLTKISLQELQDKPKDRSF